MKIFLSILITLIIGHNYSRAQQKETNSATTQAKKSSGDPIDNTIVERLPDINKLDPYHRTMLTLVKEQGKSNEYNKLLNFLYQRTKVSNKAVLQNSSILSSSMKSYMQEKNDDDWESTTTRLLWDVVSSGYTLEKLEELSAKGLNVLDIVGGRGNHLISSVLCSDLVIICTVDTLYTDEESYGDANRASFFITVNETLKGDSAIKKIVVRQPGFIRNGKYQNMNMHSTPFSPTIGDKYLLSVSKHNYEFSIKQQSPLYFNNTNRKPIIRYDSTSINRRKYCYRAGSIALSLGKEGILLQPNSSASNSENVQTIVQKVRKFCTQYGAFLP